MPFYIEPLREFLVRPALPEPLRASRNWPTTCCGAGSLSSVRCSAVSIRALAGVRLQSGADAGPRLTGHPGRERRPIRATWRFTARACETYDGAHARANRAPDGKLIAYFSAEYGLTECLPVYSGGLGILSGDHLKSSSDQDYPLIGLGLLYQQGYFRQMLNPDGWQQERYPINDFYTLPLMPVKDAEGQDLKVTGEAADRQGVHPGLEAGRRAASRCTCWTPTFRITSCRRTGTSPIRCTAAISTRASGRRSCWASAGMRALKAMGLKPTVFHMNEGHSAFLALEQIRWLHAGPASELRRGPGGGAHQQRLHHPHAGSGGHRHVRRRADVPLFRRLLRRGRRSTSSS